MAIPLSTIISRCNALLDSEGSDRFTFDRDFLPAISATNEYLVSVFNSAFAQNKLSEENLKEITYIKVWQTSEHSRFAFDATDVGHSLWTILAIHPKITTIPSTVALASATDESVYRSDVSFRDSNYSCKRLTAEEWALRNRNSFMAGSPLMTCAALTEYAYIDHTDYTGGYSLTNDVHEIEISPSVAGELVSMRYLKVPATPTVIGDSLEFPSTLTNLAVEMTMRFIAQKEGDAMHYQISQADINDLIKQLS